MTVYDVAMVVVVILGMVRGGWRGFTWQVASIASLVVGYIAARSDSGQLASQFPGSPEVQRALAMGVIYMVVSAGIFGVAWLIRGTLKKLKFEAYDRHLGTLLGGLEGAGVGILVTTFLVSVAPATREPIFSSPSGRVLGSVMNNLGPVLPEEVRKVLEPHWSHVAAPSESLAGQAVSSDDEPAAPTAPQIANAAPQPLVAQPTAPARHATPAAGVAAEPLPPAAAEVLDELPTLEPLVGDLPKLELPPGNSDAPAPSSPIAAQAADAVAPLTATAKEVVKESSTSLKGIISKGREQLDQAVTQTLDTDPNQKAENLQELINRDTQRLKTAVQDAKTVQQDVTNQVKGRVAQGQQAVKGRIAQGQQAVKGRVAQGQKAVKDQVGQGQKAVQDRLNQGQQQIEKAISDTITEGRRKVSESIAETLDQKLRELGGLDPAPATESAPK